MLTSAAPAIAVLWGALAVLLPVVVRGRSAAVDLLGAAGWAAGLATVTQALAAGWANPDTASQPHGVVVGALFAVVLAVGARASRGPS